VIARRPRFCSWIGRIALLALSAAVAHTVPSWRSVNADEEPAARGGEDAKPGEKPPARKPNRLAKEKSPYLLQHAHNPVDWYPWGKEAFDKAKAEGKPVFLSIGYSTCHWCHVMERESFEDEEIARYLNEHFVSIKVDREERPDVDGVYMDAVQRISGHGGWPLSAFLMADGKPFFAGTYFPPKNFLALLKRVVEVWGSQREDLEKQAALLAEDLRRQSEALALASGVKAELLDVAVAELAAEHDEAHGGFGQPPRYAPKFPRTSVLDFLLRYDRRTGKADGLAMVHKTLAHMLRGGIRDHLGGGFHRYSTDRVWLVPHFEKMLYDNALIARTLLDAHRTSGRGEYLAVALEALDYVLDRLLSPEGAFYSAEDADTGGKEGLTYVWTRAEVLEVLGKERGEVFADYYGVTAEGNFEGGPECVLHIAMDGGVEALARRLDRPRDDAGRELAEGRRRLFEARQKRPQPFLDTKVLVEWNGMAVSALAHAFQVSGQVKYLDAARRAADFVLARMVEATAEGDRLYRRFRDGERKVEGFLEDYAFLVEGLLDLYEADFDPRWLEAAVKLGKTMVREFWDSRDGGFFSSAAHHEALIVRRKEFYDGAVPSGNSVAFADLLRLEELTQDKGLAAPIESMKKVAAGLIGASSRSHPQLLCAVEYLLAPPIEVVVVGRRDDPDAQAMVRELQRGFYPAKVLVWVEGDEAAKELSTLVPLLEAKTALGGKATAYVCRRGTCKLPAQSIEALREQLSSVSSPKERP
jgi:hypothetical protein